MILPSNTPAASFPENKSSSFTTPLRLDTPTAERWRVGLVHIQIPLTFYNVESDENITIEREDGQRVILHPKEGMYASPEDLADMLHECDLGNFFQLEWDSGFTIKLSQDTARLKFSTKLGRLLGFSGTLEGKTDLRSSFNRFDPWINHNILLVLCDLVRPVQFNSDERPILQTLVLERFDFGETYFKYFAPTDYLDIQGDTHSQVSVQVTNLEGQPIRFRSGNVVLGLSLQHES